MRHKKSFNHLGRKSAHRKAMLSNMAVSLIMHKRIETTTAKAKALKRYIEPLITRSKDDSTHNRRVVFSYLQDKDAVTEMFREVGSKVGDRASSDWWTTTGTCWPKRLVPRSQAAVAAVVPRRLQPHLQPHLQPLPHPRLLWKWPKKHLLPRK